MPAYMPKDKGRARKSLSTDKALDRIATSAYGDKNLTNREAIGQAVGIRSLKSNISREKRAMLRGMSKEYKGTTTTPSLKGK